MIQKVPPKPVIRKVIQAPESWWEAVARYRIEHHLGSDTEAVRQMVLETADREAKRAAGRSKRKE